MDELSTLGGNDVVQVQSGQITAMKLYPAEYGFFPGKLEELVGGDAQENADILEGILTGQVIGGRRDMALLNAAAGFMLTGMVQDLNAGKVLAESVISSGAAHAKLRALQQTC
jgi:anthranilate phosphoribosyltransferase